jgi:hypothetical protein
MQSSCHLRSSPDDETADDDVDWLGTGCRESTTFRCTRSFSGRVQEIDADECGLEHFLELVAGKVQVVERDAEMQLVPYLENEWPSGFPPVVERSATKRSNEDFEVSGLQDSKSLPWHLDRIDQRYPPLDKMYTYANAASSVRIYGRAQPAAFVCPGGSRLC